MFSELWKLTNAYSNPEKVYSMRLLTITENRNFVVLSNSVEALSDIS